MILLTACGMTIAGYGFARAILKNQIRQRLSLAASERGDALLAYLNHQKERGRVLNNHSQLSDQLDWYADQLLTDEQFREQAGRILTDVRRILEPSNVRPEHHAGRCLAITLVDALGQSVARSGSTTSSRPRIRKPSPYLLPINEP